jgi:hypothetical protein
VFGPEGDNAVKVARCESNLNPAALGDTSLPSTLAWKAIGKPWGPSVGVFQIRLLPGRPERSWLESAENNIRYAKQLHDAQGWGPWSCKKAI